MNLKFFFNFGNFFDGESYQRRNRNIFTCIALKIYKLLIKKEIYNLDKMLNSCQILLQHQVLLLTRLTRKPFVLGRGES
jgi:hypothetical protein